MSKASVTNLDIAVERVVGFAQKFDRSHFDLACHAAFPQTLTPDLLYQIWLRFVPQAPWTAVARILLSRLCREVGYELYEMDVAVRNLLLTELKEDERFGKQQLSKLADFHTNYLKQQLGSEKKQGEDLTQSQYWIALANSHPNQVNRQLAEAIELRSRQKNWRELFRLASLIESVPEALVEFDASLITYARGMLSYTTGDLGGAIEEFNKLQRRDRQVDIAGIDLSIPNDVPLPTVELDFLRLLLHEISNSDGDRNIIYPILQANLGKINYKLAELLRESVDSLLLDVDLEVSREIAVDIGKFSDLLSQFPLGSKADNLEIAIVGYEISSGIFIKNKFSLEWAITQFNLGRVYSQRIRGEITENIEIAIRYFQSTLHIYTREAFPEGWAMTQFNLGKAYSQRIQGKITENIETAIRYFQLALEIYTYEVLPEGWAITQFNLGKAYRQRIWGEKKENIEIAISCFLSSLQIFTYQEFPENWADIQNNLAVAYTERIEGNWESNLERAIICSQKAFQVYTPDSFPQNWAETQNNLGIAYRDRLTGNRYENLEQAINCFQNALQIYSRESLPKYWAETQNNLGVAYRDRLTGNQYENLEQAIDCFQNALQIYTLKYFPQNWAEIQNNLGIAYRDRLRGDRRENSEQAIDCFQNALQVYTRDSFPQNWAETQNNLGIAYRDRLRGDRSENSEQTINYFRSALEIYTYDSFPKNYLETLFNLALTYQLALQLSNAYEAFAKIIDALESDRGEKQEFTEQSNKAYQRMVKVCLGLGYSDRAIEYIEQNKGHSSIELLVNYNINPKNNVSDLNLNKLKTFSLEIFLEYLQLKSKDKNRFIDDGITQEDSQLLWDNFLVPQHQTRLAQLQEQMDELITQENLPKNLKFNLNQRVDSITFDRIKSLVPDEKTAILEWYLQDDSFQTFIITKQSDTPSVWQSSQGDNSALTEWANQYFQDYQENKRQWRKQLSLRLQNLAQILHIDELIRYLPTSCDRLILIPHRVLHCIPLHALPFADGSCLLDRFTGGVRYIPSCQLLKLVQTRQRRDFDRFFAIQNPTGNLTCTDIEVETIQQYFPFADVLNQAAATKNALNQQKLNSAHCLHFSGHSDFDINSPLQSCLMLADEPLSLAEVFTLDLSDCRLVTLSASETALTSWTDTSDDYLGFPSAFLLAGSNSVVGSFWNIDDLSTALLMINFYHNLQIESTIAIALNQSQLWLRNITKLELEQWISENLWRLSPTLRLNLRRKLHLLSEDTQPFMEVFYWAAFSTIGQ
jgi:CHAT domain-containing protein